MAFRGRVWIAGKVLVLIGGLLSTYLLFAAISMRIALKAREVQVPDLTNRTASDATDLAADMGLPVHVDEMRRIDPVIAADRVIAQDPPAGATTRAQRTIRVWLSAGQRAAIVPGLVGQTDRSAQVRLADSGFPAPTVSEIRSDLFPLDVVIAQEPAANASGTRVALLVNRTDQADTYVMPDLIGVNGERAVEILRERGVRAAVVGSTSYPGVAPGIVLRQNPQAGFQIATGEPISIEVSR
jgi:beta-lactam-binding protein with PASTA domain